MTLTRMPGELFVRAEPARRLIPRRQPLAEKLRIVPEPSRALRLMVGLMGVVVRRRRK